MIPRYTTSAMDRFWSEEFKFNLWRQAQIESARVQNAPITVLANMERTPAPSVASVEKEEESTGHDVVAFINAWRSMLSPGSRPWVHRGMTSSDLVDTANAMRFRYINTAITNDLSNLIKVCGIHALTHQYTVRVARTHGQVAEISTWGYRMADFTMALDRARTRYRSSARSVEVIKMSGPVGDYKYISPNQEAILASRLGLHSPDSATQVLFRDGYADLVFACAQLATAIEAIALEIRLSQRSEVDELREGRSPSQIGSSSMPHKRNPIISEKLCGLARVVRAQVAPMLDNIPLHHERDISHSSVERVALPTAVTLAHYMIVTAIDLITNLEVDKDSMLDNIPPEHLVNSAFLKSHMVSLGVSPSDAHREVSVAFSSGLDVVAHVSDRLRSLGLPAHIPDPPVANTGHVFDRIAHLVNG